MKKNEKRITLNFKVAGKLGVLHPYLKDPDSVNVLTKVHLWLLEN